MGRTKKAPRLYILVRISLCRIFSKETLENMMIYDSMHHKELYSEYLDCSITGETKELLYKKMFGEERTRRHKGYMDIV